MTATRHAKVSGLPDGPDPTLVRPSDWDADHSVTVSATDRLLGRATAGAGDVEEITCTAAGRAFLDDLDVQAQRNTLVLGAADNVQFGKVGIVGAPVYQLDVGTQIAVSGGMTGDPIARIGANVNNTTGVQMSNSSTGTLANFRFLIRDPGDHYFAFSQPGTGNTGALFGLTNSTVDLIVSNGGTPRTMVIGPFAASPLVFGTNNAERMRILSSGEAGIGEIAPTARLHVKGSVAATVVEKLQAAASQTGDILQCLSSAAAVLTKITSAGFLGLPGGLRILGFVSSGAAPTTTELPTNKDCAIHKDTVLGTVTLAFNDGGTIKRVTLV